ncbi:MAG: hypothetical protein K2X46_14850, partial [Roseomonas sp.]|nr:hypothetical protein [Roseomonas sp.]
TLTPRGRAMEGEAASIFPTLACQAGADAAALRDALVALAARLKAPVSQPGQPAMKTQSVPGLAT